MGLARTYRTTTQVAVIGLLTGVFLSTDAATGARSSCATPHGYRVEAKTRKAVVLVERHGDDRFGCLFSVGRHIPVAPSPFYKLSGRYVAYRSDTSDVSATRSVLMVVRDLKNGHFRHIAAMYKDPAFVDAEAPSTYTDVTLKRNGSVAWISCFTHDDDGARCLGRDPEVPFEVWRADTRGHKLLDKSSEMGIHSLKRDGSNITWRKSGDTRSATLR
jgi:hypothetical protein